MDSDSNRQCDGCFYYYFIKHHRDNDLGRCMNMDIPLSHTNAYVIGNSPCYCTRWKKRHRKQKKI